MDKVQSRTFQLLEKRIDKVKLKIAEIEGAKEFMIPLEDKLPRSSSFTKHLIQVR